MVNPNLDDCIQELDKHQMKSCISQQYMKTMDDFRKKNFMCDAIIHLDDGTQFNVHRATLSASSDYFRTLFTKNHDTNKQDAHISNIRKEIMEELINYAYLRECHLTESNIYEMLIMSDYMAMIGLTRRCTSFILQILKPENCIDLWKFSNKFSFCLELSTKCRSYIIRNFVKVAQKSEQILKIDCEDFYSIISDDMLNVKDEAIVWECCLRWIDHDSENRTHDVAKLLQAIRLGLLNTDYFIEKVLNHPIVLGSKEAVPIMQETITFFENLDKLVITEQEEVTPIIGLPRVPSDVLFAIGGWGDSKYQDFIESYDIRADRWIQVPDVDPMGPRAYHGVASIGYKIYCIGGYDGEECLNTCRVFDPIKKSWNEIAPMHTRRCYVSVTLLDGFIYAMGGFDGELRQSTAERYDPNTNQWSFISSMSMARSDADACSLNGKIYIVGGFNGNEFMSSVEVFDPEFNVWTDISSMNSIRSGVKCVALGRYVYALGGFNEISRLCTVEKYDPDRNVWQPVQGMLHKRSNFAVEIIDDMIYVMGGHDESGPISSVECYASEMNSWILATDMGMQRSAVAAITIYGLPNITNYINNRQNLMEEHRQKIKALRVPE